MHGYELMGQINQLFAPRYRTSAGAVYPALAALAEAELVTAADAGGRATYRLAAQGRRTLDERRAALIEIEQRTGVVLALGSLEATIARLASRARAVAADVGPDAVEGALSDAHAALDTLGSGARHRRRDRDKDVG